MATVPNPLREHSPWREQHLTELLRLFPVVKPTPDMSLAEVMYQAGIRHVVDMVERKVRDGRG